MVELDIPVLNWTAFIIYSIIMVSIGYLGYRRTNTGSAFSLADRNLSIVVTMALFGAAFASAATLMGFSGFAYSHGWAMLAVYPLGVALGWLLLQMMSPKLRTRAEWHTYPDMLADRFPSPILRGWFVVFNLFYLAVFIVISLMGVGKLLVVFLEIDYLVAITMIWVVFMTYTLLGGMYGVGWTNVLQWVLMLFAVLIAAIGGIMATGGLTGINQELATIEPGLLTPTAGGRFSVTWIIGAVIGLATAVAASLYYHRIAYAARSQRVARSTYGFVALIMAFFYIGILFIGISGRVAVPGLDDPEMVFPELMNFVPTIIGTLAILGVIAALHSSIDNQLLSAGVLGSHDLYKELYNENASERQLAVAARGITFIVGIVSLLIALWEPALIIEIYTVVVVFMVPCVLFPPMVLGLYWRRTTTMAVLIGSIFGAIGALVWYLYGPADWPPTLTIMPASFVLIIVISLLTDPPAEEHLQEFF